MTTFGLARDAIEAVVARNHPAYSNNWATIVPMSVASGWGLSLARWSTEMRQMQNEFHARISPRTIWIPVQAVGVAGNQPLDVFLQYMVQKANHEG